MRTALQTEAPRSSESDILCEQREHDLLLSGDRFEGAVVTNDWHLGKLKPGDIESNRFARSVEIISDFARKHRLAMLMPGDILEDYPGYNRKQRTRAAEQIKRPMERFVDANADRIAIMRQKGNHDSDITKNEWQELLNAPTESVLHLPPFARINLPQNAEAGNPSHTNVLTTHGNLQTLGYVGSIIQRVRGNEVSVDAPLTTNQMHEALESMNDGELIRQYRVWRDRFFQVLLDPAIAALHAVAVSRERLAKWHTGMIKKGNNHRLMDNGLKLADLLSCQVIVSGHNHAPEIRHHAATSTTYMNTGSVGQDGLEHTFGSIRTDDKTGRTVVSLHEIDHDAGQTEVIGSVELGVAGKVAAMRGQVREVTSLITSW